MCGGPIDFLDAHKDCVMFVGCAHAEAALEGSDCKACEELPMKILGLRLVIDHNGDTLGPASFPPTRRTAGYPFRRLYRGTDVSPVPTSPSRTRASTHLCPSWGWKATSLPSKPCRATAHIAKKEYISAGHGRQPT
ncbi:hypothetical protein QQF64_029919 [Cirrhinus molitorella]|uniref:Uncharacterized protein n=1 Tax=Cirrhinus molitorella TaxID=172907 RepID=A0ABR3N1V7_9TELE